MERVKEGRLLAHQFIKRDGFEKKRCFYDGTIWIDCRHNEK